jgi:hypothetical protein
MVVPPVASDGVEPVSPNCRYEKKKHQANRNRPHQKKTIDHAALNVIRNDVIA